MHRGGDVFTSHTGSISNSMQGRELRSSEGGIRGAEPISQFLVLVDSYWWIRTGIAALRVSAAANGLGIDSAPCIV